MWTDGICGTEIRVDACAVEDMAARKFTDREAAGFVGSPADMAEGLVWVAAFAVGLGGDGRRVAEWRG